MIFFLAEVYQDRPARDRGDMDHQSSEVQATLGCYDRRNSPGVSIGQDWADLGVKPFLEQVAVAV